MQERLPQREPYRPPVPTRAQVLEALKVALAILCTVAVAASCTVIYGTVGRG